MKRYDVALCVGVTLVFGLGFGQGCSGGGMDKVFWQSVKTNNFTAPSRRTPDELAACLGSLDPELRDALAYEIFTNWLRGGRLSALVMKSLVRSLVQNLGTGIGQAEGESTLLRSFSALILSEAIRRDNQASYLEPPEFAEVLNAALAYLPAERDLRGFDSRYGYVHGVAHGSDLLWRLASSPKTGAAELQHILEALASKIALPGEHFYVYGEPERLDRAFIYALNRGVLDLGWVKDWVRRSTGPDPLGSWGNAFSSQSGLARLHSIKLFLLDLYATLSLNPGLKGASELLPVVKEALEAVSL